MRNKKKNEFFLLKKLIPNTRPLNYPKASAKALLNNRTLLANLINLLYNRSTETQNTTSKYDIRTT